MTINLNKKTLGYASAFLAFVALILWGFLNAIQFKTVIDLGFLGKSKTITNYSGFRILFGITNKSENFLGQTVLTEISKINWMSLATYVLGLVGIFCMIIRRRLSKIGVIALLLTTVLVFLSPLFVEWFLVAEQKDLVKELGDAFTISLSTPAIINGVVLGLATLFGVGSLLVKK